MRITELRHEAAAAVDAVRAALIVIEARESADEVTVKGTFDKGVIDIATGTDVASQAAIQAVLARAHPEHAFVGEESGMDRAVADRSHWLVDPICGTKNFAARVPLYAVNVALVEDRVVSVGAVGDGAHGDVFVAARGRGAFRVDGVALTPIRVDAKSTVVTVDPGRPGGPEADHAARALAALVRAGRWELRILGTSLDLAYVASGRFAAVRHFSRIPPLHFAAGTLLVSEAGGIVSDGRGAPWTIDSDGLIATSTRELRDALLGIEAR